MAFWGQEASASIPTGTEGPLPEADPTLPDQCPMASSPQPPTHPTKITAMRFVACSFFLLKRPWMCVIHVLW